jgi:hypothetical protein
MRDSRRNRWRFEADPAVEYFITQTAAREGRSNANMILILLREAIQQRRSTDQKVTALANAIRTVADVGAA